MVTKSKTAIPRGAVFRVTSIRERSVYACVGAASESWMFDRPAMALWLYAGETPDDAFLSQPLMGPVVVSAQFVASGFLERVDAAAPSHVGRQKISLLSGSWYTSFTSRPQVLPAPLRGDYALMVSPGAIEWELRAAIGVPAPPGLFEPDEADELVPSSRDAGPVQAAGANFEMMCRDGRSIKGRVLASGVRDVLYGTRRTLVGLENPSGDIHVFFADPQLWLRGYLTPTSEPSAVSVDLASIRLSRPWALWTDVRVVCDYLGRLRRGRPVNTLGYHTFSPAQVQELLVGDARKAPHGPVLPSSDESGAPDAVVLVVVEPSTAGWFEGGDPWPDIASLEDHIELGLTGIGQAEIDGHDLALDGSEVLFYIYGSNLSQILDSVRATVLSRGPAPPGSFVEVRRERNSSRIAL